MTGYFSEPLAFGMRAYKFITGQKHGTYDVIHDNQALSYGIADIKGGLSGSRDHISSCYYRPGPCHPVLHVS